jgi:hypothetical protein
LRNALCIGGGKVLAWHFIRRVRAIRAPRRQAWARKSNGGHAARAQLEFCGRNRCLRDFGNSFSVAT